MIALCSSFQPLLVSRNWKFGAKTDATTLSSISDLSTLTSLYISHNAEQTSPQKKCSNTLPLSSPWVFHPSKKLKELPTSMASLTALKRLDIRSCHSLESLPEQVLEGLTSLTELFIQDCEMLKTLIRGIATPNNPYKTSSCSLSRDSDLAFQDSKLTLSSITGDLELPSPAITSSWDYGHRICKRRELFIVQNWQSAAGRR